MTIGWKSKSKFSNFNLHIEHHTPSKTGIYIRPKVLQLAISKLWICSLTLKHLMHRVFDINYHKLLFFFYIIFNKLFSFGSKRTPAKVKLLWHMSGSMTIGNTIITSVSITIYTKSVFHMKRFYKTSTYAPSQIQYFAFRYMKSNFCKLFPAKKRWTLLLTSSIMQLVDNNAIFCILFWWCSVWYWIEIAL